MAILNFTMYSQMLHRHTDVTAIVPAEPPMFPGGPKFDPDAKLRTIYLLHGYSGSHSDWLHGSNVQQYASAHRIAIICPSAENSFYIDDAARDALYDQYICKELVEFTRRLFPLSRERKDTSIGGLSMGGYGAIRNGLKYNDTFGNIIALSSALITDGISKMPDDAAEKAPAGGQGGMGMSPSYFISCFGKPSQIIGSDVDPKALAKKVMDAGVNKPNIYMACGSEDFLIEPNRDLHNYLESIGYDHKYTEGHGTHAWEYWDPHIRTAMDWLEDLAK